MRNCIPKQTVYLHFLVPVTVGLLIGYYLGFKAVTTTFEKMNNLMEHKLLKFQKVLNDRAEISRKLNTVTGEFFILKCSISNDVSYIWLLKGKKFYTLTEDIICLIRLVPLVVGVLKQSLKLMLLI